MACQRRLAAALLCWGATLQLTAEALRQSASDVLDGEEGAPYFTIHNNSTLPINFLALPKLIVVHAAVRNHMQPGKTFEFLPGLVAYNFHVVIDDGNNAWEHSGELSWGFTKLGVSYAASFSIGAGVGGTIAVSVTAAVTATLAAVVAPYLLVPIAFATFWGTAVISTMTVSAITDTAMDFIYDRIRLAETERAHDLGNLNDLEGMQNLPADHPERLLYFEDVVNETSVRKAFLASFPGTKLERLLVTRRNAKAYFGACVSEFTDWKLASGKQREFLIKGGFTKPQALPGTTWFRTTFEPLGMGDIVKGGLCEKNLAIKYHIARTGETHEITVPDWDALVVAEKSISRKRQDQVCKKTYVAMCAESAVRVITACRLQLASIGVEEPVWEVTKKEDRDLYSWFSRSVDLDDGDSDLRLVLDTLPKGGIPISDADLWVVDDKPAPSLAETDAGSPQKVVRMDED